MMEKHYLISDASKTVDVESHVLRYWEEELELKIGRNEMGHRFYTEDDIQKFQTIKKLKSEGYGLRAIKNIIKKSSTNDIENKEYEDIKDLDGKEETNTHIKPVRIQNNKKDALEINNNSNVVETIKVEQFKDMLSKVINKALINNNASLCKDISKNVSTNVIKEINYNEREKEEREEERYHKLDETIRMYQKGRAMVAATKEKKKRLGFHFKKRNRKKKDKSNEATV